MEPQEFLKILKSNFRNKKINLVRASGLAEVWTHTHDNLKFNQFGWRCTTNENSYSDSTFVGKKTIFTDAGPTILKFSGQFLFFIDIKILGNWREKRFDTAQMVKRQPVPS